MVDLGLTIVRMWGGGGATGGSGAMDPSGRRGRESHRKGFDKIDLMKVVLKPLYTS